MKHTFVIGVVIQQQSAVGVWIFKQNKHTTVLFGSYIGIGSISEGFYLVDVTIFHLRHPGLVSAISKNEENVSRNGVAFVEVNVLDEIYPLWGHVVGDSVRLRRR